MRMTVGEAIFYLKTDRKKKIDAMSSPEVAKKTCTVIAYDMGIEALEKQIPKKPVIKYHKEDVTPVKYGRLMEFHCPNCNKFIVAMYETDHKRGGGIHRDLKGCSTCLQAIDFGEYYHMNKLDDEIELE